MATYTRPISINWQAAAVELYLTVQADAAGSTILRERASIGTTGADGWLLVDIEDWDGEWSGYAVIDDDAGAVVRVAFESQQANVQAGMTAQGLTTARAAAIDTIESQTAAAQQQANATAALTAAGLDSTSVTNLKDAAAVAGAQATTAAAQATAAAAGVAAIAAGETVVRADNRSGQPIDVDSAGTGARTVTITVNDGSNAIEGARVRVTAGIESHVQSTGADGTVVFNLNDGTWTVAIAKTGYTFDGDTLEVDSNESPTYSLTRLVIVPADDPGQTTGYLLTYDAQGAPASGQKIYFQLIKTAGDTGRSFPREVFSATSDEDGLLQVALVQGATYQAWRNRIAGEPTVFTTGNDSTFQLPEVLGALSR